MAGSDTIKAGVVRRKEIVQFVTSYIASNRVSPSVQEITEAVGLASKTTTRHHLDILVGSGDLVRDSGKYRTLRLPQPK